MAEPAPRMLTLEQAAAYVGVSPAHFSRLVASGVLPAAQHFGRCARWDSWAIDRVLSIRSGLTDDTPVEQRGGFGDALEATLRHQ